MRHRDRPQPGQSAPLRPAARTWRSPRRARGGRHPTRGGIVTAQSLRVGGDRLDAAITDFVRKEHSLLIGERTAEDVKVAIGSAWPVPGEEEWERATFTVRGREKVSGLPRTVELTVPEVR